MNNEINLADQNETNVKTSSALKIHWSLMRATKSFFSIRELLVDTL